MIVSIFVLGSDKGVTSESFGSLTVVDIGTKGIGGLSIPVETVVSTIVEPTNLKIKELCRKQT